MDIKINLLITGGAGFIGSNLVEYFLEDERVGLVRVLDNLSNGYIENIQEFFDHPRFEFIEGDIRDYETCLKACEGIDKISHQAALGSVPRSIENPMQSTEVNILGTVNLMYAAVQQKVERIVLAFSSSTYGDHPVLPKVEENIGNPLSPYAVTKASIEQFANVFGNTYGLKWIGLRYFNVFGPKQSPDNPYAAVIPLFIKAALNNYRPHINGDGNNSRDFTYVKNVLRINDLSLFTTDKSALNEIYNVAQGKQTSLLNLWKIISNDILKLDIEPIFVKERAGDVLHSLANIDKSKRLLGYHPSLDLEKALKETIESLS
jgi:UDP-N-acetylglucosamine 4-epimerase